MRISVVTICYNAIDVIEKTILSIIKQTYNNIEYIVVDGGSNDGTLDIVKKYDEYISKWVSEPDKGIYNAMNKALKMVTGDWVCFMNAGDLFADNNVLNNIFGHDIDDNVAVIYGLTKTSKGLFPLDPFITKEKPFSKMGFCHQSCFVRTSLAKGIGFDESYKLIADFNMMYNLYKQGCRFENSGIIISEFDITGVSSTRQLSVVKEIARMQGLEKSFFFKYLYVITYIKIYVKKLIK